MNRNEKLIALLAVGAFFHAASSDSLAATINYTVERGGNTWTLGDNFVGLIGFSSTPTGQTITEQDILDDIQAGGASRVVGVFNGVDNLGSGLNLGSGTVADYESTTFFSSRLDFATGDKLPYSNGIDPFTAVDLLGANTRFVAVAFVVFEGSGNLVFRGDSGGTATLNANGSSGAFPAPLIPEPSAVVLVGLASAGLCSRRR